MNNTSKNYFAGGQYLIFFALCLHGVSSGYYSAALIIVIGPGCMALPEVTGKISEQLSDLLS